MIKKSYVSRIIIIAIAVAVLCSSLLFAFKNNTEYAFSDAETSTDAGTYSIKDDFRFNGLNDGLKNRYFYSYSGVTTGLYGDYKKGLYPSSDSGYLVYKFNLDGNGIFIHFRTLRLETTQNFNGGSISVSYALNDPVNSEYNDFCEYNSDLQSITDFTELLNSIDKSSTFLYVKITLKNVNLFTVSFKGMMNFVMKNGACIRESSTTSAGDLKFRAFIATDCYEMIKNEYSSFSLGVLMIPTDYCFNETKKASFDWGKVKYVKGDTPYVGDADNTYELKDRVLLGGSDPLTVTVNGVSYYYYDGIIRLPEQYLTRQLTCKAYISAMVNGSKSIIALASFYNQRIENNSRSEAYIAIKILENSDEILTERLNKLFLNNILTEWKNTIYTVRKIYIDNDYTIIDVKTTDYKNLKVNEKVVLTDDMKKSDKTGYSLISNEIKEGETVLYKNSTFDRAYPVYENKTFGFLLQNQKLVIDLFYTAN